MFKLFIVVSGWTVGVAAGLPIRVVACTSSEPFETDTSFAALAEKMRAAEAGVEGVARIVNSDWSSLFVAYHPDSWRVNTAAWRRMDADFGVVDPSLLSQVAHVNQITEFINDNPPVVAANLDIDAFYYAFAMKRFHIKTIGDTTIGFLPLWGDANKVATVDFETSMPALTNYLRAIAKVDLIIGICLFGYSYFAQPLTPYDLDAVLLPDGDESIDSPTFVNDTWLISKHFDPTSKTQFTVIDVNRTDNGWRFTSYSGNFTDTLPKPHTAQQAADQQWYLAELSRSNSDKLVGSISKPLIHTEYSCMKGECEAGNLISDAIMAHRNDIDVVLMNGGGIFFFTQSGWDAGDVSTSSVTNMFPFSNTICLYQANATGLWMLAEHGVHALTSAGTVNESNPLRGALIQTSGLRIVMDPTRPPYSRVVELYVFSRTTGAWEAVDREKMYTVASTSYLCVDGGDGYSDWWVPDTMTRHQENVHTLTTTYLKAHASYLPVIDGRLVLTPGQGTPLLYTRQTPQSCDRTQRFDLEWELCTPCPAGTWQPEPSTYPCVPLSSTDSSIEWYILALPLLGAAVIVGGVTYWLLTNKQRRIKKLYTANKIAEDCAHAIAGMHLSEVDYLFALEKPTPIQSSFIAIVSTLKEFRDFMPQSLLAGCALADNETVEGMEVSTTTDTPLDPNKSWLQPSLRSAPSTVLVANLIGFRHFFLGLGQYTEAESMHRAFLQAVLGAVQPRGVPEPFVGDKVTVSWNAVSLAGSHREVGCRAALAMSQTKGLRITVSVACGDVVVGNVGVEGLKKYAFFGSLMPEVYFLQQLNKEYGTNVLVNASMLNTGNWRMCFQDRLRYFKYKKDIELWELQGEAHLKEEEWMYVVANFESTDPLRDFNRAWALVLHNDVEAAERLIANGVMPKSFTSYVRLCDAVRFCTENPGEAYYGKPPLLLS